MAEAPTPIAEIDHGPSKFEQFMEDHQSKLIIGAILIALGVIGYVIWSGLQEAKNHEAGNALVKADEIANYQDVIKKYPGSTSAASAMPLLADLQWQDSQPESIKTLEDFLAQNPEHPAAHNAAVSLGLRLLEQGKTDEAREKLAQVAESHPDSYIAPMACIAVGDIEKAKGNAADAKSWYEKAKGDGERTNAFLDLANARIAIVNAKPPVKIQPAPPAPPTPPAPTTPTTPGAPSTNTPEPGAKPSDKPLPAPDIQKPDTPTEGKPETKPNPPKKPSPEKPKDKPEPTP